ncbi:MAG: hypothetical protein M0P71_01770 [Melioribacteraceae bacterium]|nr:hypothetical protein [Melioribacteraceae bacterium]
MSRLFKAVREIRNSQITKTSKVQDDLFGDINDGLFSDIQALSPEQVEIIGLRAKNKFLQVQNKRQAELIAIAEVEIPKQAIQLNEVIDTNKKLTRRLNSVPVLFEALSNSNRTLKGWCTKYRNYINQESEAEAYIKHLEEQELKRTGSIPFPTGETITGLDMAASISECRADKLERLNAKRLLKAVVNAK